MKIFKNLTILATLYFLGVTFLYAASGSGLATVYKINVNKLELCETGSSLTTCLNPITVSKAGLSTDVDLASITAGEAAATLGNFGLAKSGVTYTYVQTTMSRAITAKGSASDGTTTCFTKGNGSLSAMGAAETTSGDSTEATLYVPAFVDATNFPQINSVADREGTSPRTAGTVNASDSHFQSREALALPFTLDPTAIPTVTIAFSTAGALTVHEADDCDGESVMYATPPNSTITIQGQ
jgi:hypothetical protein